MIVNSEPEWLTITTRGGVEYWLVPDYIQRIQIALEAEQTNVYFQDGSALILNAAESKTFIKLLEGMGWGKWIVLEKTDHTVEWLRRGYIQRVEIRETQLNIYMQEGPPISLKGDDAAKFMEALKQNE